MSETFTNGKRRAVIPSESGSTRTACSRVSGAASARSPKRGGKAAASEETNRCETAPTARDSAHVGAGAFGVFSQAATVCPAGGAAPRHGDLALPVAAEPRGRLLVVALPFEPRLGVRDACAGRRNRELRLRLATRPDRPTNE